MIRLVLLLSAWQQQKTIIAVFSKANIHFSLYIYIGYTFSFSHEFNVKFESKFTA